MELLKKLIIQHSNLELKAVTFRNPWIPAFEVVNKYEIPGTRNKRMSPNFQKLE